MKIHPQLLAWHGFLFVYDWLQFTSLGFMLAVVLDFPHGGYRCQWQVPLREALIGGVFWATLMWWPLRKRAHRGALPRPRGWWLLPTPCLWSLLRQTVPGRVCRARVVRAHFGYFLSELVRFAGLSFITILMLDSPEGGHSCLGHVLLIDAVLWGALGSGLHRWWWVNRPRGLAGQVPLVRGNGR